MFEIHKKKFFKDGGEAGGKLEPADIGVLILALLFHSSNALLKTTASSFLLTPNIMLLEAYDNNSLAMFLYCAGQMSMKSELFSKSPLREATR